MQQSFYVTVVLRVNDLADFPSVYRSLKKIVETTLRDSSCSLFLIHKDSIDKHQIITWKRFETEEDFCKYQESDPITRFFSNMDVDIVSITHSHGVFFE